MAFNNGIRVPTLALAAGLSILIAGCGDKPAAAPATRAAPPTATPSTTSLGNEIDDTVITGKVKSALLADPEIKSFDLKVDTWKGEVQLSGKVDNQSQMDLAVQVARAVEGVKTVANGIGLKEDGGRTLGNAVDDGVITASVKTALLADPGIKSFDIAVVTRKGEVQLSGFVGSQTQIDQAVAIAQKVEGVTQVGNEMKIRQ